MTARKTKITIAAALTAAAIAGCAGYISYKNTKHEQYMQFYDSTVTPVTEKYSKTDNGNSFGDYYDIEKTELLTGQIEIRPHEKENEVIIDFRGDLAPEGQDRSGLYRYIGAGTDDYYLELCCAINTKGEKRYTCFMSATNGNNSVDFEIDKKGNFRYTDDFRQDAVESAEKNKDKILQLKTDFEKEVLGDTQVGAKSMA